MLNNPCRAFFCGLLAITLAAGCQLSSPPAAEHHAEQTLDEQIATVREGALDRIQIEHSPLSDDDVGRLSELTSLRELLIDESSSTISATGIRALAQLPKLEHLRIRSRMDDNALAAISELKSLKILNTPQSTFSDGALASLQSLPQLESFRVGSKNLTDAGMVTLARLPALTRLHLIDVPITDAGLRELAKIEQLESLYIDGANLSDAAFDELFRERPQLHVHVNQQHHDRDPHAHP